MLYSHGLRLPWEDLCRELELHFAPIDAGLTIFEKKDHKQLIKLASRANYFFTRDCLPKIYEKMGSYFAVNSSALVMSSLSLFPTVLHLMVLKMRMIFVITSSRFSTCGKN